MKPSLLSSLPAPKHDGVGGRYGDDEGDVDEGVGIGDAAAGTAAKEASPVPSSLIPPYPQRKARKFVPRRQADFADGGAYPEIHVAQYPLNMGKPGARASDSAGDAGADGECRRGLELRRGARGREERERRECCQMAGCCDGASGDCAQVGASE